jgi:formate hydrogenlyase transcriptional activator
MITKSKLSEFNLSEIIMDSMPGLVFFFAKDGQLVAWNKKVEEVLGYSKAEFEAAFASRFSVEDDKEKVRLEFRNAFKKGFAEVEHRIRTKSGREIPSITKGIVVKIANEEYLIGLSLDISELDKARKEILRLNELLQAENIYLKGQLELSGDLHKIIGTSESIKYILYKAKQVASTDATVLIQGETGTGKELVARAIHAQSERKDKPFIKVNCASIPEDLIESELFGHEKGSFTSAIERRIGRFEIANGGTIFLDEIGELPLNLQPKLLQVLQQGEFERIGSSKTKKTDVRVIAATNKILEDEIKNGSFRKDLFYRLNVFPITVTPLRERKTDIPALTEYYTNFYSQKINKPIKAISKLSLKRLMEYEWPGNIRELENVIERAIINSNSHTLNIEPLPKSGNGNVKQLTFEENEKTHIIKTLERTNWKINGAGGAAQILKINPQTLRSKMKKLDIKHK